MKTLLIGVGNPTRRDDGAGSAVAERIAALNLPGVEVQTTQQLQVELVEDFARYDRVVVVDASVGGDPVGWKALPPELRQAPAARADCPQPAGTRRGGDTAPHLASHHLSPALLLALTRQLHGHTPELLLCTVRGEQFGFGDSLSSVMADRIDEAVRLTVARISPASLSETT
jgi:hydrogenase maturation protease